MAASDPGRDFPSNAPEPEEDWFYLDIDDSSTIVSKELVSKGKF